MRRTYEGTIDLSIDENHLDSKTVSFVVDYDFVPAKKARYWNDGDPPDPPEAAEATVTSLKLIVDGEKVDCPKWLESMILSVVNEEFLIELEREE